MPSNIWLLLLLFLRISSLLCLFVARISECTYVSVLQRFWVHLRIQHNSDLLPWLSNCWRFCILQLSRHKQWKWETRFFVMSSCCCCSCSEWHHFCTLFEVLHP
jgi:hypothetical protein